jgi:hypothetical protein
VGLRTISYGGGVQSTALLVLAAREVIDFPVALFANTGDDSEHPATLAYIREVAMPWAERQGIEVIELQKHRKDGSPQTVARSSLSVAKVGCRCPGPVPPKSACTFCPFHSVDTWKAQAEEEPELFLRAVELERTMNEQAALKGQRPVFLTRYGRPLDEVVDDNQQALFNSTASDIGESGCDEGVCFV